MLLEVEIPRLQPWGTVNILGGLTLALSACATGAPRDTSPARPPEGELASASASKSGNQVVSQFSWLSEDAAQDGGRIVVRCTRLAEGGGWGGVWVDAAANGS